LVVLSDALHDALHITRCQGRFLAGLLRYLLVLLLAVNAVITNNTTKQQNSGIIKYAYGRELALTPLLYKTT
jgi:hypothetical protein